MILMDKHILLMLVLEIKEVNGEINANMDMFQMQYLNP